MGWRMRRGFWGRQRLRLDFCVGFTKRERSWPFGIVIKGGLHFLLLGNETWIGMMSLC